MLRQGNAFTPVCDSVHGGGGRFFVPTCTIGHMTRGSLSRGVSVWGSLSGGSLSSGVSVQGVSIQKGVSVHRGLCPAGSLSGRYLSRGSLSRGSLCRGFSVRETPIQRPPCTVMSRWYASYWNAFLFGKRLKSTTTCSISESISSTLTWSVSHVYRGLFAMKGEGVPSQSALYFLFEFS